jgi:hypothetical protein
MPRIAREKVILRELALCRRSNFVLRVLLNSKIISYLIAAIRNYFSILNGELEVGISVLVGKKI